MNKAIHNTTLLKELEYVRAIKNGTSQTIGITNPGFHLTETNLLLLAECIFKYMSNNQSNLDLQEIKIVSNLVQKQAAAYTKIKTLEIKIRQLTIKEQLLQSKPQKQEICHNSSSKSSN